MVFLGPLSTQPPLQSIGRLERSWRQVRQATQLLSARAVKAAVIGMVCGVQLLGLQLAGSESAHADTPQAQASAAATADALGTVSLASLPAEAQQTERLVRAGGPFPYPKDGTVFGNRERLLPRQARGYYREYTVRTPGAKNRGARRLVCGGRQPTNPEACFYTDDHYASFRRLVP